MFLVLTSLLLNPSAGATEDDLGEPVSLRQVKSGSLLLRTSRPGFFLPAPSLETNVSLKVTGLVARAVVRQRFSNPTEQWVEGIYVFPLPENAAVDELLLVIGERTIVGEIHERKEAKRIYEQAKKEGKKASLLEQERPNMFTTSVANLGPGEVIEVVIEYQQELRYDQGRFTLRFPMVVAPRYIPRDSSPLPDRGVESDSDGGDEVFEKMVIEELDFSGHGWATSNCRVPDASRITPLAAATDGKILNPVHLELTLDAGLALASIESPSHRLHLEEQKSGSYRVILEDGVVPADRDFVITWEPEAGSDPQAALFSQDFGGEQYLLLMVLPPHGDSAAQARLTRETIFVIDTSGSMKGASIKQAREALLLALDRLQPGDYFNIIQFNFFSEKLFPVSVPANSDELSQARKYVESLQAEGGTEMLGALQEALASSEAPVGLSQVIFITDGSIGNEDELFSHIHQHLGNRRLFTVGIGSAPNSHFMQNAAEYGRGTFTYIGSVQEVAERMDGLFSKLESPVLHDIEVIWDDPMAETLPHPVGDLYLGEPVQVAARLPNGASEVTVRGFRGTDPWETHFQVSGGAKKSGLDRLWARRKIAALMKDAITGADQEETRSQVIEVALHHHLVSKYTSLVAVDKTPTRPEDELVEARPVPVQLPAGQNKANAHLVMPQGGTSARLSLLLGTLALLGSLLVLRWGSQG
jgi:Ca-activated chloride channel family protein